MPEHIITRNRRGIGEITSTKLTSDDPEDFRQILNVTLAANSHLRTAQQIRQENSLKRTMLEEKALSLFRTVFEENTALELADLALSGENGTKRITEKSGDLYRIKETQE